MCCCFVSIEAIVQPFYCSRANVETKRMFRESFAVDFYFFFFIQTRLLFSIKKISRALFIIAIGCIIFDRIRLNERISKRSQLFLHIHTHNGNETETHSHTQTIAYCTYTKQPIRSQLVFYLNGMRRTLVCLFKVGVCVYGS